MNSNFNQELMQDFLEKIIQKRKEREMIAATEIGLMRQVVGLINVAISSFKDKALKVKCGRDDVIFRLITSKAKGDPYYGDIVVKLGLACSPAVIKGKTKITTKEAGIDAQLQKIWDRNMKYDYFCNREKYMELADNLCVLSHHICCYREFDYTIGIDNFYRKEDLLKKQYDFKGLGSDPYYIVSTRDLVRIKDLLG